MGILKLAVKLHLTSGEDIITTTTITLSSRQKSHARSPLNSAVEATNFDVGALWSVNLAQIPLELVHVLNGLAAVHGEATFVKTNVTVPACSIRVVLYRTRVHDWGRRGIPALLRESSHWVGRCRRVRLVEASIVLRDERVTTCAIAEVVHMEGVGLDLGARHHGIMVPGEDVCFRHAIHR